MTEYRYCPVCKKETRHRKLEKHGFFTNLIAAAITSFKVDLRQPDFQCNECGVKK